MGTRAGWVVDTQALLSATMHTDLTRLAGLAMHAPLSIGFTDSAAGAPDTEVCAREREKERETETETVEQLCAQLQRAGSNVGGPSPAVHGSQ
jgi:hypothetical protein